MQVSEAEQAAMHRALALAETVRGRTSPNPAVGAVILDAAAHLSVRARPQAAGGPHAEVVALAAAGRRARGGTAVVTLEPCAHTGRTGPCADALVAAGVARVVYAVDDPNPVAAGGADRLRAAGVEVVAGVDDDQAPLARCGRGCTRCTPAARSSPGSIAATLDGRVAAADRHVPLDLLGGIARRRPRVCARSSTRSWSAAARCWPTTRS